MTFHSFVAESNKIEGITRNPTPKEVTATRDFVNLAEVTVADMSNLVDIYAPCHHIRHGVGMDVIVGSHMPPAGGPMIPTLLDAILGSVHEVSHYALHVAYESLHPYTDGNGRSGRALWLWKMNQVGKLDYALNLGFLHAFYYQTLASTQD